MTEKTLTHKDLGDALDVSVTTIKSYRRKFPGFIPVAGYGKPIRFPARALAVCSKIRECFVQGLSVTETEKRLVQAGFQPEGETPATSAPAAKGHFSQEYLEKFFKTAGQMMQGMAQLATAQARSEQRLSRLEKALQGLLEAEAGSQALLGELAAGFRGHKSGTPDQPGSETQARTADSTEKRLRSKKIINVHGKDGVDSYTLANEPEPESPSKDFLAMPVAIRSEQGDFLGLPGRLSLADFTAFLIRNESRSGSVLFTWEKRDDSWFQVLRLSGGNRHELGFARQTTGRGVDLAVLMHLDRNGSIADHAELLEFFRQAKDMLHTEA